MTKKSFLIIFFTAIFIVAAGYFVLNGYNVLTRSFEGAKEVTLKQDVIQDELSIMYISVRERTLILLRMNTVQDAFDMDDLRQEMRENAENYLLARQSLSDSGVSISEKFRPWFNKLDLLTWRGSQLKDSVADLFVSGNKQEALDLLVDTAAPVHVEILSLLSSMKKSSENEVRNTVNDLNDGFVSARKDFRVIGVAILFFVLVVFSLLLYILVRGEDKLKGLLAHKETQYKVIVDTINDGVFSMNKKGKISSFNCEAERVFGFSAEEIVGETIYKLIDKSDLAELSAYINTISNEDSAKDLDIQGRTKDSRKIHLQLSLSNTGIAGEQCLSGVVRDVTQQKNNTKVLLRYREVFSKSYDAQAFVDMNHIYTLANEKYLKLFGKNVDDVINFTVAEVIGEKLFYTFEKFHQRCILNDEVVSLNQWVELPSKHLYLSITYTPFHNELDEVVGIAIAIRDITEQKRAEDDYFRSSKLESIGVLAGGIAHDFNNLLGSIIGNIEMSMRTLDEPERADKYLQTTRVACKRAAGLTQQLLTFSKGGEPIKSNIDIAELLAETIDFSLHGCAIESQLTCNEGLRNIFADRGQIGQVVQNIVINAKQAMPAGGLIKVDCSNISKSSPEMKTLTSAFIDFVKISITDTGSGMSEDVLNSIFDPYFTTRDEGSGLGLALSYSIINKHAGFINVESMENVGTTFSIYLPATDSPVTDNKEDEIIVMKSDNTKRIMIMDDDEMIREIGEAMLEELGYLVEHAATGEQAIEAYQLAMQDSEKHIDLIIMDLTILGGMGGKEAAQEVLTINPDAKILVSSGYSNDPVMADFQKYGFSGAVTKPYTLDELAIAIQQSL